MSNFSGIATGMCGACACVSCAAAMVSLYMNLAKPSTDEVKGVAAAAFMWTSRAGTVLCVCTTLLFLLGDPTKDATMFGFLLGCACIALYILVLGVGRGGVSKDTRSAQERDMEAAASCLCLLACLGAAYATAQSQPA